MQHTVVKALTNERHHPEHSRTQSLGSRLIFILFCNTIHEQGVTYSMNKVQKKDCSATASIKQGPDRTSEQ